MSNHMLYAVIDTVRKWQIKSGHDIEWIDDPAWIAARLHLAEEILSLVTTSKPIYSVPQGPDSGVNAIFGMCPDLPLPTAEKEDNDAEHARTPTQATQEGRKDD